MTNIDPRVQSYHVHKTQPSIAEPIPAALSAADRWQLKRHLHACNLSGDTMLAHVLRHKLGAPERCGEAVPRDAVVGGATLDYRIDNGPVQSGLLCHRSRTGGVSGVIPVLSLLGATLIGMRTGQRAPLLREDGAIVTVAVLSVAQPN